MSSRTRRRILHAGIILSITVALSACMQNIKMHIPKFADKNAVTISENTLKTVNRTFYKIFIGGDWYYQGAKVGNGIVNAYIQIPQKLDMDSDVQEQYLQQIICPGEEHIDMWSQLRHYQLAVHLYTVTKKQSVSAKCHNPIERLT